MSRLGEGAHAVLQTLEVEDATLNGPLAPETLAVAIPKGAEVLDSRAGRAVYYAQGDRDATLAEVTSLAEKQAADAEPPPPKRPKLGVAAPALALKDLDEVIALRPDGAQAYFARAQSRRATGDIAGAKQGHKQALLLDSR